MPSNSCHKKLVGLLQTQEVQINRLYGRYSSELASLLRKYNLKSNKNVWKGNVQIEKEVDRILLRFKSEVLSHINVNLDTGWNMSNDCNDDLTNNYLKGIYAPNAPQYFQRNLEALEAFKKRRISGLGLSDRVWGLTHQTKDQLETILQSGVMEGRSAAKIASDLKGYLVEPDRRYRRLRDANGKLVYTSPGKDYHPGQGVYRSSYKNALRLARNETNLAYRSADHERRQQLDFVTGIEVHLSNAHPMYDICDELQGKYPKNFVFVGWHPNCICYATSTMLSKKEFVSFVNGGKISKDRYINSIPKRAEDYLNDNSSIIKGWSNKPYFIQDNFKNTKDGFGLKKFVTDGLEPSKKDVKADKYFISDSLDRHLKENNIRLDDKFLRMFRKEVNFRYGKDSYYRVSSDLVTIAKYKSDYENRKVLYHELGHALDQHNGFYKHPKTAQTMNKYIKKYMSNNGFKDIENKAREMFKAGNVDGYSAFMDTVMSLNVNYGSGHTKKYFLAKGEFNRQREFLAHSFENRFIGNRYFEKIAPDLYEDMKKLINELSKEIK